MNILDKEKLDSTLKEIKKEADSRFNDWTDEQKRSWVYATAYAWMASFDNADALVVDASESDAGTKLALMHIEIMMNSMSESASKSKAK
ncbi:hypothetical protein [Deinococcus aquaticus]|uniref:Uncharacterized protein n=1 Tax=Deinococcus aquaticus TaxID=328692 RepID=A0ABY7UZ14_9DEIO|nr:hypothetical protein [Deinococcus aquaticus]WDA58171.1 hypothetical protein M8445_12550 [Deinococcus aquaticus]